jgi:hypothetical protein
MCRPIRRLKSKYKLIMKVCAKHIESFMKSYHLYDALMLALLVDVPNFALTRDKSPPKLNKKTPLPHEATRTFIWYDHTA